jgi:hypothetical protein
MSFRKYKLGATKRKEKQEKGEEIKRQKGKKWHNKFVVSEGQTIHPTITVSQVESERSVSVLYILKCQHYPLKQGVCYFGVAQSV